MVESCPDDIVARVAPSIISGFVRWEPPTFLVNGIPVEPTEGPLEPESLVVVGDDPVLVRYSAVDEEQGISRCEFRISAIVIKGKLNKLFAG